MSTSSSSRAVRLRGLQETGLETSTGVDYPRLPQVMRLRWNANKLTVVGKKLKLSNLSSKDQRVGRDALNNDINAVSRLKKIKKALSEPSVSGGQG